VDSTKKIGSRYDRILLASIGALVFLGIVMVYSSSSIYAREHFGSEYFFIRKHLLMVVLGSICLFVGLKMKQDALKKLAYPLLFISLGFLIYLLVSSYGVVKSGAASRWLNLHIFSFQPSEVAKITLVIFLAAYISRIGDRISTFKKGFLPCMIVSGIIITLIVLQPDFGTAITVSLIVLIILFVSGVKITYLVGSLLIAIPPVIYLVLNSGYRHKRILAFLNPWEDPLGSGFQMIQSFIAFSNGGFLGQGLGDGKQKLLYLPEAHTDFIFSVIGEELGFIGVMAVVLLFGLFIYKGLKIAFNTRDSFGMILAVGITCIIGLQAIINIGVTMGLLPTKGLTLPFISYGGTSLILTMFASGLLLNLSARMNQVHKFKLPGRI